MIDLQLQSKVIQAASTALSQTKQIDLKSLWGLLAQINPQKLLCDLQNSKLSYSYGALPISENPGIAVSSLSPSGPVAGIDGSQIYPSPFHPVHWAYIQALAYSTLFPIMSKSEFLDLETAKKDNSDFNERYDSHSNIDFWRTTLELSVALQVMQQHPDHIILMDYPLLPWIDKSDPSREARMEHYVDMVYQLRGALVAGVVSAPKSLLLVNLIGLSEKLSGNQIDIANISDTILTCEGLGLGQRSAIFTYAGSRNQIFQKYGIEICFFFVRIRNRDIVRIEIPNWIAKDLAAVDLIHSSILKDSEALGYSYALAKAHQEVVIPLEIANDLHELATREYVAGGGNIYGSAKMRAKGF
jgi:hypothetical protein